MHCTAFYVPCTIRKVQLIKIPTSSAFFANCGIVLTMYLPPNPTAAIPRPASIKLELIFRNCPSLFSERAQIPSLSNLVRINIYSYHNSISLSLNHYWKWFELPPDILPNDETVEFRIEFSCQEEKT